MSTVNWTDFYRVYVIYREQTTTEERHRSSPCNPFSQALPDSPQYTGL